MATLLYRIGRFSYRHPWRVVAVWLIIIIGILGGGLALGGKTNDSFTIPGTESQNAIDRLAAVFPSAAGASAEVVFVAPTGADIEKQPYRGAIADFVKQAGDIKGVDA